MFVNETSIGADGQETVRNLTYTYDSRYQLRSEAWAGESYVYDYDLAGNRLSMDHNGTVTGYTYNSLNELKRSKTGGVATTYRHDANGNRIEKAVDGAGTYTSYRYDTQDRLVWALEVEAGEEPACAVRSLPPRAADARTRMRPVRRRRTAYVRSMLPSMALDIFRATSGRWRDTTPLSERAAIVNDLALMPGKLLRTVS